MARPREFNEVEALESAMETFQAKGYEASSLMDLLKAMGLSKSSLYNSFGTKHQLFLSSIDHYAMKSAGALENKLRNAPSARAGIRQVFIDKVEQITNGENLRGCLLQNSALEVLPQDQVAARHIANGINRNTQAFASLIKQGQAKGEIPSGKSAEALGEYLTMNYMGLRTLGRLNQDRAQLEQFVDTVLSILD